MNSIDLDDVYYMSVKQTINAKSRSSNFFAILDKCRSISKSKSRGCNIIRYRFLQNDNLSKSVMWDTWIYKVNDPIIFNEFNRFYPIKKEDFCKFKRICLLAKIL